MSSWGHDMRVDVMVAMQMISMAYVQLRVFGVFEGLQTA